MKRVFVQTVCVFVLLVLANGVLESCKEEKPRNLPLTDKQLEEKLIEANRKRVHREKVNIDSLIESKEWDMLESGTGMRYQILKAGRGDSIRSGNRVEVSYSIIDMLGDTIYSSKRDGTEEFTVGMDHVESGIHEAVSLMREGDCARVILPAHLAHGLMGDDKEIPSNAALIYYLEIVSVQ